MAVQLRLISPRVVAVMLIFVVGIPLLPILISWQWNWWEAWLYAGVTILGFVSSRWLVARSHPDLLAERAKFLRHQNAERWDRILAPLLSFGGGMVPLVAGLDALLMWSPQFDLSLKIPAIFLMTSGYILGSYALVANPYFSGVVRIQADRGHKVISQGPYKWIRHPGYAGGLLTFLATPILLDSGWAFLPVAFTTLVLVVRTSFEDRTLQDKLEEYRTYAQLVRYRLIPGIW